MTRALSPAFAEALASAELCPVVFSEGGLLLERSGSGPGLAM